MSPQVSPHVVPAPGRIIDPNRENVSRRLTGALGWAKEFDDDRPDAQPRFRPKKHPQLNHPFLKQCRMMGLEYGAHLN